MKIGDIGRLVITKSVSDVWENNRHEFGLFFNECFSKYLHNDWGDVVNSDRKQNKYALKNGERILASYNFPKKCSWIAGQNTALCIITEWDRSVTTVLFPSDY